MKIMLKVDRALVANSLGKRIPFLDLGVFKTAWKISLNIKFIGLSFKDCLEEDLFKYVLGELIERLKTEIRIPLEQWLRAALSGWARKLLNKNKLKNVGFINDNFSFYYEGKAQNRKRNCQFYYGLC